MSDADKNLRIGILGLGHVGLITALGFAEVGWNVIGADTDLPRVQKVNGGTPPFYEPQVAELLRKHLASGRFRAVSDAGEGVRQSDIIFICVGTPPNEDGSADLSQVQKAASVIAQNLDRYKLIVEKSTAPVGTARWIERTILRYGPARHEFEIACNPEFLREGTAVSDFLHPDRIVIGASSDKAKSWLRQIYAPFDSKILMTDRNTAELIKHSANAFLALKISYINMVSDLCEQVGADAKDVALGIGMDPRIGPSFLRAGIGYGGSCFPKDVRAFIKVAESMGIDFSLLREVEHINQNRVGRLVRKIEQSLWVLKEKRLAVWGLAFKPGTDDVREAPSLGIVRHLLQSGASLRLYDPQGMDAFRHEFPEQPGRLVYLPSAMAAAEDSHAVLVLTEWDEFRTINWPLLRERMAVPVIVDGRNWLDAEMLERNGFEYHTIGRPVTLPSFSAKSWPAASHSYVSQHATGIPMDKPAPVLP